MRGVGEGPRSVFFWFSPIFRSGETSKIPFSVFLCSPIPRKRLLRRLVCILIFFHSNVPFLKWQIGKRGFTLTFVFLHYWMKYKVVIRWRTFRSEKPTMIGNRRFAWWRHLTTLNYVQAITFLFLLLWLRQLPVFTPGRGGGGTPLYGLYRYVRPWRVWFFSRLAGVINRVSILADFSHFGHK